MLTLAKSNSGLLLCHASVTQENIQKRHVSLFMGKSRLQKFEGERSCVPAWLSQVNCMEYAVKVKLRCPAIILKRVNNAKVRQCQPLKYKIVTTFNTLFLW